MGSPTGRLPNRVARWFLRRPVLILYCRIAGHRQDPLSGDLKKEGGYLAAPPAAADEMLFLVTLQGDQVLLRELAKPPDRDDEKAPGEGRPRQCQDMVKRRVLLQEDADRLIAGREKLRGLFTAKSGASK